MYEQLLAKYHADVPAAQAREMQALFHRLPVWNSLQFQNTKIIKNPLDLWMVQQIICETRHRGDRHVPGGAALWSQYVEFLLGSSTDRNLVEKIRQRVQGKRTLVMLDSDHSRKHVLAEMAAYAPMVSKGSYLIVEDTHLDGIPTHPEQGPGPMAAVREFLADGGDKEFEQDFTREALLMTFPRRTGAQREVAPSNRSRPGRACHRDLKRGHSRAGRAAAHELGPAAQTGFRHRH